MIRLCFFSLFLCALAPKSRAQTLQNQVLASAGLQSPQIDYTIGETFTQTLSSSNAAMTQGFHQNNLLTTSIEYSTATTTNLLLFPNPTEAFFTVYMEGYPDGLFLTLYDAIGQKIDNQYFIFNNQQINVAHLPAGSYLAKFESENKNFVYCTKFIKISN